MVICFEGASAIGKTSLCQLLADQYLIVPEVNLLFQEEIPDSKFWYYQKQVVRYQICSKANQSCILDGDPFQPLWYNWIYGYPSDFPSFEETMHFYTNQIASQTICFPDLYIVFETSIENLYDRKAKDRTRKRRNFEKHLQLIEPQKCYFQYLKEATNIPVVFLNYDTPNKTKGRVLAAINSLNKEVVRDKENFEQLRKWFQ